MPGDASTTGPFTVASGRLRPPTAMAAAAALTMLALVPRGLPAQVGNVFDAEPPRDALAGRDRPAGAEDNWRDDAGDLGVFLPGDRTGERMLDRARRLIDDARWSDAAAALDELLAGEKDAFATGGPAATRGSIRTQAAALVDRLPRPGREAYERLFGGRAQNRLAAAIAADDQAGIVAVARRWLQTPAGGQAALITAMRALEAGQPLAAIVWLDRLAAAASAADFEPTLSIMRAAARAAAGDEAGAARLLVEASRRGRSGVRIAGRDAVLDIESDGAADWLARHAPVAGSQPVAGREWRQFRGTPARNAAVEASQPLLVPRYRVPLVPHPEEGRRLEKIRLAAAAEGEPLLPAGTPVAVGDQIVVQTPIGILGIDFVSGRRIWLASALPSTAADALTDRAPLPRVFSDATSGNLASDGRSVFAVEIPPEALAVPQAGFTGFGGMRPRVAEVDGNVGNSLSAYDLKTGRVRWRLQGPSEAAGDEQADGSRWHLGPPLVVGEELFVLVEERGEVRLEVRDAADAALRWTQPLATYDDGEAIATRERMARRLAGLTPALGEGVLVCPLGGGCVVAIDLANRSLLWAHGYPRPAAAADRGGFRPDLPEETDGPALLGEPAPVIAGDRVILAPFDAGLVICLGLADGRPIWRRPRDHRVEIAGAADGRLLLVDADGVEAIGLDTGGRLWHRGLGDGVRPSGRCMLTTRSLLVPCDAPAVIEIALADGSIIGRGLARGGGIPGSLVAHRGEVISRGIDFLDVFHQEQALDGRIETALQATPEDPWAAYWAGQAALEAGDVSAGLDHLARAAATPGFRIPPGELAAAVVRGMERDFLVAARRWESFPTAASAAPAADVERMTVDGFLDRKDPAAAWPAMRRLLRAGSEPPESGRLLRDPADPRLFLAPARWLESRLARLSAAADESLRREIDAARGEWSPAVAGADRLVESNTTPEPDLEAAWPLGQVEHRDFRREPDRPSGGGPAEPRPVPLAVAAGSPTRAAQAAIDVSGQRLLITDDLGRPLARPLAVPGLAGGFGLQFLAQSAAVEVAAWGHAVFIRSATGIVAHQLGDRQASARPLWNNEELGTETGDAAARWIGGVGGRIARDGAVPLGMRIAEPDDRSRGGGRGMTAVRAGLLVPGRRSVTLLDPASGGVLWRRERLPAGLEWFVDDEFLCGCTVDGRGSLVLATADGRLLHEWDVPHRRQRVASRGRRFVAVHPLDEPGLASVSAGVRLELVDPGDREIRPLGLFDGQSRAAETGDGRLAVLAPDGRLTVFDLADGSVVFQRDLPGVPRRFERLHVQPWRDRYLLVVGASADDEPQAADVSPLEPLLFSGSAAAPLSGGVWAVDRADGRPLWSVPAVIERHCLHTAQPRGLPLLAFCRILRTDGTGQPSLSVLCLDKRTGHAVFQDDRIELRGPAAGGCDLVADPEHHTVAIGDAGVGGGRLVLAYTGRPIPPQTPFQSRGRPALPMAGLERIESSLNDGGPAAPGHP